jgi:3'(2'), 5'-bisphosphate nucleotidase
LKYFGTDLVVQHKTDQFDPVSKADKEADNYLRRVFTDTFPGDEILSEENETKPSDYTGRVWMIDPLDGTKDFIAGRTNYSIIIGLLEKGHPVLGVVYAPSIDELFYAEQGTGAFSVINGTTVSLRVGNKSKLSNARLLVRNMVTGDIRQLDNWLDRLNVAQRIPEGSIGLKLSRIAENAADVYINSNQHACKWDTLGPQVILTEAGGVITDINGVLLDYSKATENWNNYFIAASNETLLKEVTLSYRHHNPKNI